MRKGDKITRWIIVLLLISTIVAAAEGAIYYSEHIKEGGFYIALIAENCVHTFTNDANITISDAIKALGDAPGKIQFFVCVAYCVAILVAPACTLAAIYRVLATLLKIRFDLFELNS